MRPDKSRPTGMNRCPKCNGYTLNEGLCHTCLKLYGDEYE